MYSNIYGEMNKSFDPTWVPESCQFQLPFIVVAVLLYLFFFLRKKVIYFVNDKI